MEVLIHKHSPQMFQVKATECHHHMMRQVYKDCSGLQQTNWKRVPAATVEQLREECLISELIEV
jgi:hypothetical protein